MEKGDLSHSCRCSLPRVKSINIAYSCIQPLDGCMAVNAEFLEAAMTERMMAARSSGGSCEAHCHTRSRYFSLTAVKGLYRSTAWQACSCRPASSSAHGCSLAGCRPVMRLMRTRDSRSPLLACMRTFLQDAEVCFSLKSTQLNHEKKHSISYADISSWECCC